MVPVIAVCVYVWSYDWSGWIIDDTDSHIPLFSFKASEKASHTEATVVIILQHCASTRSRSFQLGHLI